MKKTITLILFSMTAAIAAISCKPEAKPEPEPGPEPDKKVPVEQSFNVKAGDVVNVEFESYAAWSASADAEWISFTPAKGEAGAGIVVCTIGAQKPSFTEASKGTLAITVEGKAYNMTFLREASVRATRFTDANGNPIEKLVFDANADGGLSVQLTVEANYYWDLDRTSSPWPAWISDPGRTNVQLEEDGIYRKTFTLNINETEAGDADKSAEITFIDLEDETYKTILAVEYIAPIIPEQDFSFICELGTEIHVTPSGQFKDQSGNVITGKYWLDFSVDVEDLSEFKIVRWDATAYDTMWHSSNNVDYHYFSYDDQGNRYPQFLQLLASITEPSNPKAYSLFVAPGAFSHDLLKKNHFSMGYLSFIPQSVWEPYSKWADNPMFFTQMMVGGAIHQEYYDPKNPETQAKDEFGLLVHEIKEKLRKYTIRVYIDKE